MRKLLVLFIVICYGFTESNGQGFNTALLSQWKDSTLTPSAAHNNTYNEVWGFEQDGRRYAALGSTAGTHFFDITDPINIKEIEFLAGKNSGSSVIHRDYHDYNGYLYIVCDEGQSSLRVADLKYLPDSIHLVYDSDTIAQRCHNIFIDTTSAKLYLCNNSTNRGFFGLEVADISDPEVPVLVASYPQSDYGQVHDIYVKNDTGYLNSAHRGVYFVDFSDPKNDSLIGLLGTYPDKGYNHSGWLSEDSKTYVFADETHGTAIKITDVSDFSNVNVLNTFETDKAFGSIPHNLMLFWPYVYVSYYYNGFQMYDVSNPMNITRVANYNTSTIPVGTRYEGAWGIYTFGDGIVLVSDMQNGLFVLNVGQAMSSKLEAPIRKDPLFYPNPNIGEIWFDDNEKVERFDLLDIHGREVYSHRIDKRSSILPRSIPNGIYILRSRQRKEVMSSKLILNR